MSRNDKIKEKFFTCNSSNNLLPFQEKPFWKMNTEEKLEACKRKKMDGNTLFKAGKFQQASIKYDKECKLIIHFICITYIHIYRCMYVILKLKLFNLMYDAGFKVH